MIEWPKGEKEPTKYWLSTLAEDATLHRLVYFAKLRWERTLGKTFPVGRAVEPEAVAGAWPEITSFEKSEHPPTIAASMQPVIDNLNRKSKGGNEFIDVDAAWVRDLLARQTK